MIKKSCIILFAFLLLLSLLSGCSENKPKNNAENSSQNLRDENDTDQPGIQSEIFSDFLPKRNLNGRVFNILGTGENYGAGYYVPDDVVSDGETGEAVNDATYRRNSELQEEYNFSLNMILSNNIPSDINKVVNAGVNEYDAVIHIMQELAQSMLARNLYDMNELKYVDFKKPWWNQSALKDLQLFDGLYLMGGDIVKGSYLGSLVTYFSKSLAVDLNLPDLYDIVRGGDWTIDKMFEFAKLAKRDADGDGKWDYNDVYGLMLHQKCIISLYYAAGEKLMKTETDGSLELCVNNSKTMAFIDKMLSYISEEGTYQQTEKHKATPGSPHVYADTRNMMCQGRILFLLNACGDAMLPEMRSNMGNFGILPLPKFDKTQDKYYSSITFFDQMLAVPLTVTEPDDIGFMLEAVCARSSVTTKKAIYDITLINKGIRDDDSEEMLDLIFENIIFDIGYILNPNNLINLISDSMDSGNNTLASKYAANESKYMQTLNGIETEFGK